MVLGMMLCGCSRRVDPGADQLVVVTLNTHSFQEGERSLAALEDIGRGLAVLEADLVGLNEVMSGTFLSYDYAGARYDGTELIRGALEGASGERWYEATFGFAHWETGELMSNVVLSRTPITERDSRPLTTTDFWPGPGEARGVGFVRTVVPGLGPIHLYVTHTWGWDSADTLIQIAEVKAFMAERDPGDGTPTLLVGDLNLPPTHPAFSAWLGSGAPRLLDTWALAHPTRADAPTQRDGPHRIDYVLLAEGGRLGQGGWTSSPAFDGSQLPVVSDHLGVVTRFELPR